MSDSLAKKKELLDKLKAEKTLRDNQKIEIEK